MTCHRPNDCCQCRCYCCQCCCTCCRCHYCALLLLMLLPPLLLLSLMLTDNAAAADHTLERPKLQVYTLQTLKYACFQAPLLVLLIPLLLLLLYLDQYTYPVPAARLCMPNSRCYSLASIDTSSREI